MKNENLIIWSRGKSLSEKSVRYFCLNKTISKFYEIYIETIEFIVNVYEISRQWFYPSNLIMSMKIQKTESEWRKKTQRNTEYVYENEQNCGMSYLGKPSLGAKKLWPSYAKIKNHILLTLNSKIFNIWCFLPRFLHILSLGSNESTSKLLSWLLYVGLCKWKSQKMTT